MAAAARLAANTIYKDDAVMKNKLESFALDQLNWILGLNPYDACMLQGSDHNNPAYGFFGTFEIYERTRRNRKWNYVWS